MRFPLMHVLRLLLYISMPLLFACSSPDGLSYDNSQSPYRSSSIQYTGTQNTNTPRFGQQLLPPLSSRPTQGPRIHGTSAILLDARTGKILYEKNPDQRRAVASTQKLLTALLVYEQGGLDNWVPITSADTRVEPSIVGVRAGESYRRRDLVHALLVRSGNDVARTLARDHSGSVSGFANSMNRRARQIGMQNSHFVNPHGLTEAGQYSTARDVGTLALCVWHNSTLRNMIDDTRYTLRSSSGRNISLRTTNRLAERWPACVGMKTGYTKAAGKCLVSAARVNGREIICVILNSNSANLWDDSKTLLSWGSTR